MFKQFIRTQKAPQSSHPSWLLALHSCELCFPAWAGSMSLLSEWTSFRQSGSKGETPFKTNEKSTHRVPYGLQFSHMILILFSTNNDDKQASYRGGEGRKYTLSIITDGQTHRFASPRQNNHLAFPPVGWHKTVEQPAHTTTVCAWLNTVVIL